VLPGTYTVRLVAGGKTQDQVMQVLPDPKTPGSQADMRASFVLVLRLRGDYQRTGQEIVALRALADALAKARPRVAPHADTAAALAAMQASTDQSLDAIYISKAQSWEDALRLGPGIYERIINVAGGLVGTDYPPTAGQVALTDDVETQMNALFASNDTLFGAQLMSLNALLRRDGVPAIAVKREASP
jgi:hypothetical protein